MNKKRLTFLTILIFAFILTLVPAANTVEALGGIIIDKPVFPILSSNANLSDIYLSTGTISPAFDADTTAYTANAYIGSLATTDVKATVAESHAIITINGETAASGEWHNVPLVLGSNTINIVVTAQNGITKKTYTVKVTGLPSNNANLAGITLSTGDYTPAFAYDTLAYTQTVDNSVTLADIHVTLEDSTSTSNIAGHDGCLNLIANPLAVGYNDFPITVTAQDGTTKKTYMVTIIREKPPFPSQSNNAKLSSLTLTTGALTPKFSADMTSYTQTVSDSITLTTISVAPEDSNATTNINGNDGILSLINIPLVEGDNKLTVAVTAQDGVTKKTYTITIKREASEAAEESETTTDSSLAQTSIDYSSASDWAVSEIEEAEKDKLITDRVKDNFQRDITREEFCGLAVKLYEALSGESTSASGNNPFKDTSDTEVIKAVNLGIVKGVAANTFAPNNNITRQEICVMLYRAIKLARPSIDFDTTGVSKFADENKIASWAIEDVRFMSKHGIMKGTGNNSINPLSNTTREQAVVLIKRTFEEFSK
ncbi:MAG: cadherin-like beta sandwich domain-containing protein [Ignavibacteriales bacterium]